MQTAPTILFDPNGCISRAAVSALIDKKLTLEQMQALKQHATSCPLCADAIEGAREFSASKFYNAKLNQLHASWYKKHSKTVRSRTLYYGLSTIAASLVIVFGIYFILRFDALMNSPKESSSKELLADVVEPDSVESSFESEETTRPLSEAAPTRAVRAVSEAKETPPVPSQEIIVVNEYVAAETIVDNSIDLEKQTADDHEMEMVVVGYGTQNRSERDRNIRKSDIALEQNKEPETDMTPAVKKEKETTRRGEQAESKTSDKSYYVAEVMPVFQGGGLDTFSQFLADSLKLIIPDTSIVRTIVISFMVDADGKVSKVKLLSGTASDTLNKQIIEFVKASPIWTPAYQDGTPVAMEQKAEVIITTH